MLSFINNNQIGILIVSFIIGAAVSICFIGSQAFLLSSTDPLYALYTEVFAGAAFSIFVRKSNFLNKKFASVILIILSIYIPLLFGLLLIEISNFYKAIGWVFVAASGIALFRWTITELTAKHLNPASAQNYYYYTSIAFEFGALFGVTLINFFHFTPQNTLIFTILLYSVLFFIISLQFLPQRNVEIILPRKAGATPHISPEIFNAFFFTFVLLLICFGAFKVSEDYLIKIALKANLSSYDAIRDMMANYYLLGSGLIIIISMATGHFIKQRHISPTALMSAHSLILIAVGIYCISTHTLQAFVAFEVIRRISERCFYSPAEHMIRGTFIGQYRRSLHSAHSFYYYTFTAVCMAILFTFFKDNQLDKQLIMLLLIMIGFLSVGFIIIFFLKHHFIKTLYEFATPHNIEAAVPSIQALSYLRPPNYDNKIMEILKHNPHDILRKTVIMGLSYQRKHDVEKVIIEQFFSQKEDIQITVLDALKISRSYSGIQFLMNILCTRIDTKSVRVKMNAAMIISSLYGKTAIPFLLNGLDSDENRVIANTLEVLVVFNDPKLIPVFQKFVDSPIPRIKANALMGLAHFKKTHAAYQAAIQNIFYIEDTKNIASILYVIGVCKDRNFNNELQCLYNSHIANDPIIQPCLAWAFTQLGHRSGFDIFIELLTSPNPENAPKESFMHLFLQLDKLTRFYIIEYFLLNKIKNTSHPYHFIERLRVAPYNFQEELEYLEIMVLSMKRQIRKNTG